MSKKQIGYIIITTSFILSLILHWNIFNKDLIGIHLWRQSQTQWNINNFVNQDFNILNSRVCSYNGGKDNIYRYEFPIMQWLIAACIKAFGHNILVTRIFIFIMGLVTCLGLYYLFKLITKEYIVSALGVFAFSFSPVFYYYTINPIPDNMALCCVAWYLAFLIKLKDNSNLRFVWLAAIFLSLATLSKLPFIIFGTSILVVFINKKDFLFALKSSIIFIVALLPAVFWYKWVIPSWEGNGIVNGIINSPVTIGRGVEIFKYHYKEMFPHQLMNTASTILFFVAVFYVFKEKLIYRSIGFQILLVSYVMCIIYFLFELPMIEIVHDYYMMPFLPLLFAGVCYGLKKLWDLPYGIKWVGIGLAILMPFITFNTIKDYWSIEKSYNNKDLLIYKNELRKAVPDNEQCIILNDVSNVQFAYLINKKGHIFSNDNLPIDWIKDMITRFGIKYMYSDSRKVDENPEFQNLVDTLIVQKGSIKVFKLATVIKQ